MSNNWAFGSFKQCKEVPYPLCDILSIQKDCKLQAIGGIINLAEFIMCFLNISVVVYFILNCKRRKAAVGRKEIMVFFIWYLWSVVFELILGGIGLSGLGGQVIGVLQVGTTGAAFFSLFLNGFVGYQLIEDGTSMSMLGIIGSSLIYGIITAYLAADASFQLSFKVNDETPSDIPLYIFYFIVPICCVIIYVITMVSLVFKYLQSRKQLGYLGLLAGAFLAFVLSQFFGLFANGEICRSSKGKVDSRFLVTLWELISVWWVYKFWGSITENSSDDEETA